MDIPWSERKKAYEASLRPAAPREPSTYETLAGEMGRALPGTMLDPKDPADYGIAENLVSGNWNAALDQAIPPSPRTIPDRSVVADRVAAAAAARDAGKAAEKKNLGVMVVDRTAAGVDRNDPGAPEPGRLELGPALPGGGYSPTTKLPGKAPQPAAGTAPAGRPGAFHPPMALPGTGEPQGSGPVRFVRSASGGITAVDPATGSAAVEGGAGWLSESEALAGIRDPKGADFITSRAGKKPDLASASAPFETKSAIRPWSTTPLSSGEQTLARNEWLEGRRRAEQEDELADAEHQARLASFERVSAEAKLDPLALARIQAGGRYAGTAMTIQQQQETQSLAVEAANRYRAEVAPLLKALVVATTPAERTALNEQIGMLERIARMEIGSILGKMLLDPKADFMSALMGGLGIAQGTATPATAPGGGT